MENKINIKPKLVTFTDPRTIALRKLTQDNNIRKVYPLYESTKKNKCFCSIM